MSTKSTKTIQPRRRYSDGFRRARVKDFEKGTFTVLQMSRLYGVGERTLYSWIQKYSSVPSPQAMIVEVPDSQTEKVKQLEARIAELERALGRKQIELDYHAELLQVLAASGVDVQKKSFHYQAVARLIEQNDRIMSGRTNEAIYAALGTSRQALQQYWTRQRAYRLCVDEAEAQLLIQRRSHGGLGLVKAYYQINPRGLGRDRFVAEMTWRGHALVTRRSYIRTTYSGGRRFPNLIKGLIINDVNLIWQSDTTYFRLAERFYYLTFILDVYSRRILGYSVSTDLRATANVAALKQALRLRRGQDLGQLIFHSDGGTQYRYEPFVKLLRSHGVSSSMCEVATDNAYAEKINDVIKNEYLAYQDIVDLKQLRRRVKRAVDNYNRTRLHGQLPGTWTPLGYERYLRDQAEPAVHQPLLIRDGQAKRQNDWQPEAYQNLAHPRVWAPKGVSQILPAYVILHQPMRNPQLVLEL